MYTPAHFLNSAQYFTVSSEDLASVKTKINDLFGVDACCNA